jgi:hypothetical protein
MVPWKPATHKRNHRTVASVLLATLLVTSGCVGFLTGSEALEFSASKATVSDQALSDTDYEKVEITEQTVNETVSGAGQEREVQVTNWMAQYDRSVELGALGSKRAAVFVALATPQVEVAGKTFNPVGEMSNRELLEQLQSRYDSLQVGDQVGNDSVTALGEKRSVATFEGQASYQGSSVDVYIHVTKFKHDGDFIIAVAVYPQRLDGEQSKVYALLQGLEHGG